jgi:hypothetical protein
VDEQVRRQFPHAATLDDVGRDESEPSDDAGGAHERHDEHRDVGEDDRPHRGRPGTRPDQIRDLGRRRTTHSSDASRVRRGSGGEPAEQPPHGLPELLDVEGPGGERERADPRADRPQDPHETREEEIPHQARRQDRSESRVRVQYAATPMTADAIEILMSDRHTRAVDAADLPREQDEQQHRVHLAAIAVPSARPRNPKTELSVMFNTRLVSTETTPTMTGVRASLSE